MDGKCYSLDGEYFDQTDLNLAIQLAIDTAKVGDVIIIYGGDAIPWKAGDFADGSPIDTLANAACNEAGEFAEDWPNCTKEQEVDLEKRIRGTVNQWADDHALQPTFYRVANIKEVKAKLTSETGEYESLPCE